MHVAERPWYFKKTSKSFSKTSKSFSKMPAWFSCGGKRIIPSLGRSYLLFPSSLHFNQNIQIINLLKMTGHPLILVSAVLFNSLQNLPSAFVSQEEVLRMKGGWKGGDKMPIHYRIPHQQGVSTANERRKEKADFRLLHEKNSCFFVDSLIIW